MEEKELKKIQVIAKSYYSRKDIQNAIFSFCKDREIVPRYLEAFGKRPDCLDYANDIFNYAKRGATSFHCSEEHWENPMDIGTEAFQKDPNANRIGWDFIIDIDSKYFDYAKIAAKLYLEVLEKNGIKNVGIKFSGNKGFHIIIPFKEFPEEFEGQKTKDMFPEWPRLIANYLFNQIKEPMNREILSLTTKENLQKKGELVIETVCPKCGTPTKKKLVGLYKCQDLRCKSELESMKSNRKEMICPSCNGKMLRISEREIDYCEKCKTTTMILENYRNQSSPKIIERKINNNEEPQSSFETYSDFKIEQKIDSIEKSIDVILVSPRHLFRAPYSLHEKSAFSSIVITREELKNFKPSDADPLKIKEVRNFMPECVEGEAENLLYNALSSVERKKEPEKPTKVYDKTSLINTKNLEISEDMYPPEIQKVLEGMKSDGRKRALTLLLSFFNSLELSQDYIKNKIFEWNTKNYAKLNDAYLNAQIAWSAKNKQMPPNYDKPIYKDFGLIVPPQEGLKNPINYTIKKAIQKQKKKPRTFIKDKSDLII